METNPMDTQQQQTKYKAQAPLGSVVMGGPQTNHLNAENIVFYVSIVCFILGTTLGACMATWLVLRDARSQREGLKKEISQAVGTAWNDGVMWGALSMKQITAAKFEPNDFGVVLASARELKARFVSETNAKTKAETKENGKAR